jgi:hypothetical protein
MGFHDCTNTVKRGWDRGGSNADLGFPCSFEHFSAFQNSIVLEVSLVSDWGCGVDCQLACPSHMSWAGQGVATGRQHLSLCHGRVEDVASAVKAFG